MESKNLTLEEMKGVEGGLSSSAVCSLALSGWGIMMGAGLSLVTFGGSLLFAADYTIAATSFCDHYG